MTASPEFVKALCAISAEIPKLAKTEENKFANYNFVSVDMFYAAIGPIMAKHGVHCVSSCESSEVVPGHKKWKDGREVQGAPLLREQWLFTLVHESGVMGPFSRFVTVPAEGAQAHGSSESYAQKQFLRGLFRVPTGDKDDPDLQAPATHAETVDPVPYIDRIKSATTADDARAIAKQARVDGVTGLSLKAVMEAGAARVKELG